MCGIAGFYNMNYDCDQAPSRLEAMLSAIEYRGPDESGIYWDACVGLGSVRLSVIDAQNGQQPMMSENGRYWLVFNGEIFNYIELREELRALGQTFDTQSDTEVLLKALTVWGHNALPRLNAQFAFAFYDRLEGTLMFGRDPFGERPLFFWHKANQLVFGSEIKALFALPEIPRRLSANKIRQACHFWAPLPNATVFEEITALAPGHWCEWKNGELSIYPYFIFPHRVATALNPQDAADMIASNLRNAVRLRMRSDVEVAIYLSGGLDSTIIGHLAQNMAARPLHSFSVEFEDTDFDESAFQKMAAKHIGTDHQSVRVNRADIRRYFPEVVCHAEVPLFRTAPVPLYLLAKQVHSQGIKVVLTGEGADELFLGYDIFKEALFLEKFNDIVNDDERLKVLARLYPYLGHFAGNHAKSILLFYRSFADQPSDPLLSHRPRFTNGVHAAKLVAGSYDSQGGEKSFLDEVCALCPGFLSRSIVERAQILELFTLLNGYLLSSQGDRMSSAHSVEGRYPFLDPNVAAATRTIPEDLLLHNGIHEKHILKLAFGELMPPSIVNRPKQPYRAPGADCFRLDIKDDWVADMLSDTQIARSDILDHLYARRLVEQINRTSIGMISPRLDHAYVTLLSILILEEKFVYTPLAEARTRKIVRRIRGEL